MLNTAELRNSPQTKDLTANSRAVVKKNDTNDG